jgi:hypothetical protein
MQNDWRDKMNIEVKANEVKTGDLVVAKNKVVAIVDAPKKSKVTILTFTDDTTLPLNNEADVVVKRKVSDAKLEG